MLPRLTHLVKKNVERPKELVIVLKMLLIWSLKLSIQPDKTIETRYEQGVMVSMVDKDGKLILEQGW